MRSDGLTAADWAVITKYVDVLQLLKAATARLEGRGNTGRFGAIYEIIPTFEQLLTAFEARLRPYKKVNFEQPSAPEDHLAINLRAAWQKANNYYKKLDNSPVYYATIVLHPHYKRYCDRSWRDKLH